MPVDRDAVIVSYVRTPIGKAYRGAFTDTQPQGLAGTRSLTQWRGRPSSLPTWDLILGCALQEGAAGLNTARQSALRAGLPVVSPR